MSTNFDWVSLEEPGDYKFFAYVMAEKLRNPNFERTWRERFLKSLLEEIQPVCSLKGFEKIEKIIIEVGGQKHQDEKQEKEQQKKKSNVKENKLVSLKVEKHQNKFNIYDENADMDWDEESDEEAVDHEENF